MTTKELLDGYAEDPLKFLSGKLRSEMTETEIRDWTDKIRQRREVSQTFRSSLNVEKEEKSSKLNLDDML